MPKIIKYLTENTWDVFAQKAPHSKSLFFLFSNFLGPVERSVVFFHYHFFFFFFWKDDKLLESPVIWFIYWRQAKEPITLFGPWGISNFSRVVFHLVPRSEREGPGNQFALLSQQPRSQGFYAVGTKLSSAHLTEESIYHSANKIQIYNHKRTLCFLCRSSPFFVIFQLPS